jgi:hypothetical protein
LANSWKRMLLTRRFPQNTWSVFLAWDYLSAPDCCKAVRPLKREATLVIGGDVRRDTRAVRKTHGREVLIRIRKREIRKSVLLRTTTEWCHILRPMAIAGLAVNMRSPLFQSSLSLYNEKLRIMIISVRIHTCVSPFPIKFVPIQRKATNHDNFCPYTYVCLKFISFVFKNASSSFGYTHWWIMKRRPKIAEKKAHVGNSAWFGLCEATSAHFSPKKRPTIPNLAIWPVAPMAARCKCLQGVHPRGPVLFSHVWKSDAMQVCAAILCRLQSPNFFPSLNMLLIYIECQETKPSIVHLSNLSSLLSLPLLRWGIRRDDNWGIRDVGRLAHSISIFVLIVFFACLASTVL